jgi:acyl carrier protein
MEVTPNEVNDIQSTVCASIAEMLCIAATEVTPNATLVDLGADSFHFVDLVTRLDIRFGIHLPKVYGMPGRYTVDTLVRAVAAQLAARRLSAN